MPGFKLKVLDEFTAQPTLYWECVAPQGILISLVQPNTVFPALEDY